MPKNILIFSDGTGQSGGQTPDESRSNVYKLFRAARCGPENNIDPSAQFAFYDPGLGSPADGGGYRFNSARRLYNFLSGATGLGITRNIIDCYGAIVRVWEPGDRIYLFGFSRGAYTVRCVGGVLGLCGVPTRMKDGSALKRDQPSANAIAEEAVKRVYQFGSSIKGDPKKPQRLARAAAFRTAYACDMDGASNAVPYFIGVWDTVAALGMGLAALSITALALFAACVAIVRFGALGLLDWPQSAALVLAGVAIGYVILSIRYGQPMSVARYRMAFYNTKLNPAVAFARHAISIDENRLDFRQAAWDEDGSEKVARHVGGPERFKQVYFAGVHSDIGGGYGEPEARLSDIALQWMLEEVKALPAPIIVDDRYLHLSPLAAGPQHDERRSFVAGWPNWFVRLAGLVVARERLGWSEGFREAPHDALLHPSVIERFKAPAVLIYGDVLPYRPPCLRGHDLVKQYYQDASAQKPGS